MDNKEKDELTQPRKQLADLEKIMNRWKETVEAIKNKYVGSTTDEEEEDITDVKSERKLDFQRTCNCAKEANNDLSENWHERVDDGKKTAHSDRSDEELEWTDDCAEEKEDGILETKIEWTEANDGISDDPREWIDEDTKKVNHDSSDEEHEWTGDDCEDETEKDSTSEEESERTEDGAAAINNCPLEEESNWTGNGTGEAEESIYDEITRNYAVGNEKNCYVTRSTNTKQENQSCANQKSEDLSKYYDLYQGNTSRVVRCVSGANTQDKDKWIRDIIIPIIRNGEARQYGTISSSGIETQIKSRTSDESEDGYDEDASPIGQGENAVGDNTHEHGTLSHPLIDTDEETEKAKSEKKTSRKQIMEHLAAKRRKQKSRV